MRRPTGDILGAAAQVARRDRAKAAFCVLLAAATEVSPAQFLTIRPVRSPGMQIRSLSVAPGETLNSV